MIDGVIVKPLRVIPDERGWLMEIIRATIPSSRGFGQTYLTVVYPGVVKGWHWHRRQTDHFCVVKGMAKVVLYDRREGSPTQGEVNEFFIGEKNPVGAGDPVRGAARDEGDRHRAGLPAQSDHGTVQPRRSGRVPRAAARRYHPLRLDAERWLTRRARGPRRPPAAFSSPEAPGSSGPTSWRRFSGAAHVCGCWTTSRPVRSSNLAACGPPERLEVEVGTARDAATFRRVLDGCGVVFHLAASVGVGMVTAEPAECLRNNVEGVQNLLAGIAGLGTLPRVVLFSSSEVYGKSDQVPLREDGDLVLGPSDVPRWSYASGKVMGEFLTMAEHRRTGLPITVVRCFNTCGPRQQPTYGMVVPRLLGQALRGEPLTVFGDGRQSRCFSFVDDVVGAVLALADRPETVGEVYNVGSDQETTVLELAERVREITRSASPVRLVPYRRGLWRPLRGCPPPSPRPGEDPGGPGSSPAHRSRHPAAGDDGAPRRRRSGLAPWPRHRCRPPQPVPGPDPRRSR